MCGIVGVKTNSDAAGKVFDGLKRLEYRGYDSAGIAKLGNPSIKVDKGTGTIDDVLEREEQGNTAIGHTRWATHGGVNDTNAHPHQSCNGDIAVAHNGIINNYEELKQELKRKGHEFKSETDTEVIPHLIEDELEKSESIRQACESVMDRLEGSYAVAALFDSGELVGFKQDSPLVIGKANNEHFLGSDITAFLEYTDNAIFLEDSDLAIMNGELQIYNEGEPVEREVQEIDWDAEQASKTGHDHFMEKEIKEQPKTVKRAAFQDKSDLKEAVEMLEDAEKIYLTGCGTASYAASLGAKYLREAGHEPEIEQSHELEYRTDELGEDDLVIAVSQSGETADLLSVLKKTDAQVLAVVNVVGSTLARKADHKLFVNAGPEIGVASTKAFTGQVAVLRLLSHASQGKIEEGRKSIVRTAEKIKHVIEENEGEIEELSDYIKEKNDVYFIGRDKGREMALESALKLKELSYIHAEGFAGGEFKHGTLALIEDGVPVVSFLNHHEEEILSNAVEARSRGADLIGVGSEEIDSLKHFIEVPEDENSEILEIVPLQLLAYKTSVKLGHDPDKPRNLAKSVTVK